MGQTMDTYRNNLLPTSMQCNDHAKVLITLRSLISANKLFFFLTSMCSFMHVKLQWQSPNHSHPLPQTFGINYHVIFHPFLLFLLSEKDSSIIFFRVPSPVFPHHPQTSVIGYISVSISIPLCVMYFNSVHIIVLQCITISISIRQVFQFQFCCASISVFISVSEFFVFILNGNFKLGQL